MIERRGVRELPDFNEAGAKSPGERVIRSYRLDNATRWKTSMRPERKAPENCFLHFWSAASRLTEELQ